MGGGGGLGGTLAVSATAAGLAPLALRVGQAWNAWGGGSWVESNVCERGFSGAGGGHRETHRGSWDRGKLASALPSLAWGESGVLRPPGLGGELPLPDVVGQDVKVSLCWLSTPLLDVYPCARPSVYM